VQAQGQSMTASGSNLRLGHVSKVFSTDGRPWLLAVKCSSIATKRPSVPWGDERRCVFSDNGLQSRGGKQGCRTCAISRVSVLSNIGAPAYSLKCIRNRLTSTDVDGNTTNNARIAFKNPLQTTCLRGDPPPSPVSASTRVSSTARLASPIPSLVIPSGLAGAEHPVFPASPSYPEERVGPQPSPRAFGGYPTTPARNTPSPAKSINCVQHTQWWDEQTVHLLQGAALLICCVLA
jgi:hypothetical protein